LTKTIENLPPTCDALIPRIRQAYYQTVVWSRSLENELHLPAPEESGTGGKRRCLGASATTDDLQGNRCNVLWTYNMQMQCVLCFSTLQIYTEWTWIYTNVWMQRPLQKTTKNYHIVVVSMLCYARLCSILGRTCSYLMT
jgi:hypothetical protein